MPGLWRRWSLEHVIDRRGLIIMQSQGLERVVCRHGQCSDADLQKSPAKLDCPAKARRAGGIISDASQTAKRRTNVLVNQQSPLS